MTVINNLHIHGLNDAIKASKYPMAGNLDNLTDNYTDTVGMLMGSEMGSGHDNFLCGIVVQFDLTFSIKAWLEAERYHFFDIVSSQSTMHRIMKIDSYNEYVDEYTKKHTELLKRKYNETHDPEDYLRLLYNAPTGLQLTAFMSTNYRQLKTIYFQRVNHRLPEWREFCREIEKLPYMNKVLGVK